MSQDPSANDGTEGVPSNKDRFQSCEEARRQIVYLVEDGELKEAERMLLFAHLKECPDCKAELESSRRLEARLRSSFSMLDTSPDFSQNILDALPPEDSLDTPRWLRHSTRTGIPILSRFERWQLYGPEYAWRIWEVIRVYRLPVSLGAIIFIALGAAWLRHGILANPSDSLPFVDFWEGQGALVRDGRSLEVASGRELHKGDVVQAPLESGDAVLKLSLAGHGASGSRPIVAVCMKPGAQLEVTARNHYRLIQGEAYFEVDRNRPREVGEFFRVNTPLGQVQVLGTSFLVRVPGNDPPFVRVTVKTGVVRLISAEGDKQIQLEAWQEADLQKTGGFSDVRAAHEKRLAWVSGDRGNSMVGQDDTIAIGPRVGVPSIDAAGEDPEAVPLDLSVRVAPQSFAGMTFGKALKELHSQFGAGELRDLAALILEQEEQGPPPKTVTLVLREPLSLRRVIDWLARESGLKSNPLRLIPVGRFADWPPLEEKDWGLWSPESGEADDRAELGIGERWEARVGDTSLREVLDRLAEQAGRNLVIAADARVKPGAVESISGKVGFLSILDRYLAGTGMERAWYDGCWYVAPAETIDRITTVTRSRNVPDFARGEGLNGISLSFKSLVSDLRLVEDGCFLVNGAGPGKPVVGNVRLSADAKTLNFDAGLIGCRNLERAFRLLDIGSEVVRPATGMLPTDEPYRGTVTSLSDLLEDIKAAGIPVAIKDPGATFEKDSFFARSLSLQDTLDWAARLQGRGLVARDGFLAIEEWSQAYGQPEMRVLDLNNLSRLYQGEDTEWSRLVGGYLKRLYPELFADVDFKYLRNRLIFDADRRRLQAAQSLVLDLDRDLRREEVAKRFDPLEWLPAWRINLDKKLNLPYTGALDGKLPAKTFTNLLRFHFPQLHNTVIIDPPEAARISGTVVGPLDVNEMSVGNVLSRLAGAVGLRMVIEGEVIWIKK